MSRKKTAILTGCNGEVGLKVSEKLFLNDFNVIGIDVTNKRNQYLQKYFQFDLRELSNDSSGAKVKFISDVEETLGHSGVDLLINNAAIQKIDHASEIHLPVGDLLPKSCCQLSVRQNKLRTHQLSGEAEIALSVVALAALLRRTDLLRGQQPMDGGGCGFEQLHDSTDVGSSSVDCLHVLTTRLNAYVARDLV